MWKDSLFQRNIVFWTGIDIINWMRHGDRQQNIKPNGPVDLKLRLTKHKWPSIVSVTHLTHF